MRVTAARRLGRPRFVAGDSLRQCLSSLRAAIDLAIGESGDELIAAELRNALDELGQVVGVVYTDDVLDRVFSRFCIGK